MLGSLACLLTPPTDGTCSKTLSDRRHAPAASARTATRLQCQLGPAGSCTNSTPALIRLVLKRPWPNTNSSKSESRLPCCHRGGPGVPGRRTVGTPAQPRSSPGLVVRFSQAGHQRCRSYRRPSSCTSCWRCPRRHLSSLFWRLSGWLAQPWGAADYLLGYLATSYAGRCGVTLPQPPRHIVSAEEATGEYWGIKSQSVSFTQPVCKLVMSRKSFLTSQDTAFSEGRGSRHSAAPRAERSSVPGPPLPCPLRPPSRVCVRACVGLSFSSPVYII